MASHELRLIDRSYLNHLMVPYATQEVTGIRPGLETAQILDILLRERIDFSTAAMVTLVRAAHAAPGAPGQTDSLLILCTAMPLHVASLPGLTMSIGRDPAEGGRFVKVSVNIKKGATGYKSIHRNFRSKLGLKSGAMGDPSQIGLTKTQLGALIGKNKVTVGGEEGTIHSSWCLEVTWLLSYPKERW